MRNLIAFALLTAALLLPGVVLGDINEDELELQRLTSEAEEVDYTKQHHRRHLRHRTRHHPRHRHHLKRAVLFAEAETPTVNVKAEVDQAISKRTPGEEEAETPAVNVKAEVDQAISKRTPGEEAEEMLPKRHHLIAKKLGNMDQEMHELKVRQQAHAKARGHLEGEVKDSQRHLSEAVKMRRELARDEILMREDDLKLKRLEDDRLRLDRTHGHLVASLHHIMEPKINFAETRFTEKLHHSKDMDMAAQEWKAKEDKFHGAAIAMLEERRTVGAKLDAARDALEKAKHEEEVAEKEMAAIKHGVVFNVEGYKYAKTKERAAKSQADASDEEMRQTKASVDRLENILHMEQKKVDDSMAHGKDRVQGKILELQKLKTRRASHIKKLEQEYHEWQQHQKALDEHLALSAKTTNGAADEYAMQEKHVLDIAQAKVVADAEGDSDWAWNEWPGKEKHDEEEIRLD